MLELDINDEKQLQKLERMIKAGKSGFEDLANVICQSSEISLKLLKIKDKSKEQYEKLCIKDGELTFKQMQFGSLKYIGQVREMSKSTG